MFAADAAELRIVQNQVGQFRALLHQVDLGQAPDLVMEALHADQFGEHDSGIVETKRLVEIAGQKILLHHIYYPFLTARPCEPMPLVAASSPPLLIAYLCSLLGGSRIILMGAMHRNVNTLLNDD